MLAVGLVGPGMADWNEARSLLAEPSRWHHAPTVLPAPQRLQAAERRRAGDLVKLALAIADQACAAAGADPVDLPTVFSASTGDASNCHALCEALAAPDRTVSPTRFTNSVHNAAAGYWHIATRSLAPSTSLCALDASFGAGLLEAAVQCVHGSRPVLLVAGDVPYPEPLRSVRAVSDIFGVALLIGTAGTRGALVDVDLQIVDAQPASTCDDAGLEAVRLGVPAARALPLLQSLARGQTTTTLLIDYIDGLSLRLQLMPAGSA
ncbi:MAG: beta-ketoacyl synthase chain length factor [Ideonella sp.]